MSNNNINRPRVLVAAIFLTIVGILVPNIQPLWVGALADHMGFDSRQIGLLAGVETFALGLSAALAVFWIRRVNWRHAALLAIVVTILGSIISAYSSNYETLLLARGLTGFFGEGVAFAIGLAAISESRNTDRSFAFMVTGHVTSAFILLLLLPYTVSQWGTAGVMIPLGILAFLLLPVARYIPSGPKLADTDSLLQSSGTGPVFWGLWAQLVWYSGAGAMWAFIERIGHEAGFSKASIGLVLAMGLAMGITGSVTASALGDRFGRLLPFIFALTVQIMAVLFLIDIKSMSQYFIAWVAFNMIWNYGLPYILAAMAEGDHSGRFVVMVPTAQMFGLALGATMGGFLIAKADLTAVIYFCITTNVLAALLFTRLILQSHRFRIAASAT